MHKPDELYKVVFPADLESVDIQCRRIEEIMIKHGLEKQLFSIQLLLREALNNAIIHGSNDKNRQIDFEFRIMAGFLEINVSDEGPGFNWQAALEKENDDMASSGRGLPIMKIYADSFSYNKEGNRLSLKVKIQERSRKNGNHK